MLNLKQTVQQQYQDKVNQVFELKKYSRPKEGWVRTVRKALGMSGPQLGHRIGLKRAQISQMERMEMEDRITIKQLRRVAEALNCDLVYALVPRQSIEAMLEERAITKATVLVTKVDAQMALEAQQLDKTALAKEIARETKRILETMPRDLWED
jgi:predicted DNA-binding mobile mystery protein A